MTPRLRSVFPEDYPRIADWWNDFEIQHLLGRGAMWTVPAVAEHVYQLGATGWLWLVELEDMTAIGTCAIQRLPHAPTTGELCLLLGEKGWWGKGLGTLLARQVVMQSFGSIKLQTLQTALPAYNARGLAWARSAGFQQTALQHDAVQFRGTRADLIVFTQTARQ